MACFLSILKFSSVLYIIVIPRFSTMTMLLIIEPFPHIHTSLSINKNSVAISFSIFPVTLINITINMSHSTFSIILFILSLSLIHTSIRKLNGSKSFPCFRFLIMSPMTLIFFHRINTWCTL